MSEPNTKDRDLYRSPVPRWPVVVRDDRLGTGQWQLVVGSNRRERGISGEDINWMQFSPWKGLIESPEWYQYDREVLGSLIPDDGGSTHL
jgi:hypothetical protein